MGMRKIMLFYVISMDLLLLASFTDPTESSAFELDANTLPLPCPADSTPGSNGGCVCDRTACEPPACPKHLNKIADGGETPGDCCPKYTCDSCPAEYNDTCPCLAADTYLNVTTSRCECTDGEKVFVGGECVCDEAKCGVEAKCDLHSVEVVVSNEGGCCKRVVCKVCPFDSVPTAYTDGAVENKCVCGLNACAEPDCPLDTHPVLDKKATGFPGGCCDSFICVNANETCAFENHTRYANGDSWRHAGESYECRNAKTVCLTCAAAKTCAYNATLYANGESWTTADGERCVCENGLSFCTQNDHLPCTYDGKLHAHSANWMAADGCSNCTCISGEAKCIADLCRMIVEEEFVCPSLDGCRKRCAHGFKLNRRGCEMCACRLFETGCRHRELEKLMAAHGLNEGDVIALIQHGLRPPKDVDATESPPLIDNCNVWTLSLMIICLALFAVFVAYKAIAWTVSAILRKTKRTIGFRNHCAFEMEPFKKEKYIPAT